MCIRDRFEPADAQELCEKVALLDDNALVEKMGAASRARLEDRFAPQTHYDTLMRIFESDVYKRQALIDPDKAEDIEAKVTAEYLKAFPALEGKYSFHLCESADGVEL